MKSVAEIQQAILALPKSDYAQLSRWFHELDWEQWDVEIAEDAHAGKLDFLAAEVYDGVAAGDGDGGVT